MGLSSSETAEILSQIQAATQAGPEGRLRLGQLLDRIATQRLYRQIVTKKDPGSCYANLGQFAKERCSISAGEASDLIFLATRLRKFAKTHLGLTEDRLLQIGLTKLRIVVPILRRAVEAGDADRVAEWLEKAQKTGSSELRKAKDRDQGHRTPDPVQFQATALHDGSIKLEAILSEPDWEYYRRRGRILIR